MLRRLVLALISTSMMLSPVFARACDTAAYHPNYGDGGIISTPLSAKGRFVFTTKVSRRVLRELVALHQQPLRPMLARMEI